MTPPRGFVVGWSVVVLAIASCSSRGGEPPPKPVPAEPVLVAEPLTSVKIFIDGAPVLIVSPPAIKSFLQVRQILGSPADRQANWQRLEVIGALPSRIVEFPATNPTGLLAVLFPRDAGASLGWFTAAALKAHGEPVEEYRQISELRLTLSANAPKGDGNGNGDGHGHHGDAVEASDFAVDIVLPSGTVTWNRAKFETLTAVPPPLGDATQTGWSVAELAAAAGLPVNTALRLTDESEQSLDIPAADLDPRRGLGFIKLNRRGELRFKMFVTDGINWTIRGDLRGLVRVEPVPTP